MAYNNYNTMKKIILTIAAVFMVSMVLAQENAVKVLSGYQGFWDQGTSYRLVEEPGYTVGFSTTHGCYFKNKTFVGIGLGLERSDSFFFVPIYSAVKYNFGYSKKVTPTMQLRLGGWLGNGVSPYTDLAFGLRFGSSKDFAVNVMLTGTLYAGMKRREHCYNADGYYSYIVKYTLPVVGLRVGFEL